MAERFYINCELAPGPITLEGAEAHHLATVCRLRPGAVVCLFNGDGRQYPARLLAVERRQAHLQVEAVESPVREHPFPVVVAAPLPRGDRAQVLVEKLTELGVTTLVPLRTSRTVVQPRESKRERLQRQVLEASKQCGRNTLMQVEPLLSWPELCSRPDLPACRILAHPGADPWTPALVARAGVLLAVGPEGGFSDDEVEQAARAGWQRIALGPRILRVETAAVALAALVTLPG